jgi:antitoxin (DNA-binding transcriptional repressor) of toxin-antitoxin stability system
MTRVSIRDFQTKASKYLTQLPVLLTRYGVPVAKVVGVEYEIKDVPSTGSAPSEPREKKLEYSDEFV